MILLLRGSVLGLVALAALTTPARPQAGADSAWAAVLAPVLAPLVRDSLVRAVGAPADDPRSRALAAAIAAALGVPGPDAAILAWEQSPLCARGYTARVRWTPGPTPDRAMVSLGIHCRHGGGQPFSTGSTYEIERGADGRWRVGRELHRWIS